MAFRNSTNSFNLDDEDDQLNILEQIERETNDYAFIKPATLADIDAIFCVKHIRKSPSNFGDHQWSLTIEIRPDSVEDYDLGIPEGQTLICSMPEGAQRDKFMEEILKRDILPLYNCYIELKPSKGGNDYMALKMLKKNHEMYQEPPVTERKKTATVVTPTRKNTGTTAVKGSQKTRRTAAPKELENLDGIFDVPAGVTNGYAFDADGNELS